MRQNPNMSNSNNSFIKRCMNLQDHATCFFKLLCKPHIKEFLHMDKCCALIDKYILVGVFIYFLRAEFGVEDYSTRNFYIALYLCHEIYEEVNSLKFQIAKRCLGNCVRNRDCVKRFDEDRFYLLQRMNFHVIYDKSHCNLIFSRFPHVVWYRIRSDVHHGVIVDEDKICSACKWPVVSNLKLNKLK
ncbi:hypothetical protein WA026_002992 [Henosepilachna vigintioctopunctata]|uniref:Uncharacterized protein n=1 Tax=Henosepilachna vigintioctopunctata TaxID=420089 RepID=A0AAW1TM69_9CUCU